MNNDDDSNGGGAVYPPDPAFKHKHFKAAKVIIGEMKVMEEGNIISPFNEVKLITQNGEIWGTLVSAFLCNEKFALDLWENKPSVFEKLHPTNN